MRPGFEGGQLPLIKRLPKKRGFFNMFKVEYSVVNVDQLDSFDAGSEVTVDALKAAGLVRSTQGLVKVLARGEIDRALKVKAHRFSPSAKAKIEAAGGKAEEVGHVATEVE